MKFRLLFLVAATAFLAACGPTEQQKADYASVQRAGVSSAIYDKMVHGDPLSVSDIVELNHARVNDGIVIRYIRDHGTIYVLSHDDIDYLQHNGVSPSVIDFMVQTNPNPYGPPPGPGPVIYPPPIAIGVGVGGWGHWH